MLHCAMNHKFPAAAKNRGRRQKTAGKKGGACGARQKTGLRGAQSAGLLPEEGKSGQSLPCGKPKARRGCEHTGMFFLHNTPPLCCKTNGIDRVVSKKPGQTKNVAKIFLQRGRARAARKKTGERLAAGAPLPAAGFSAAQREWRGRRAGARPAANEDLCVAAVTLPAQRALLLFPLDSFILTGKSGGCVAHKGRYRAFL